MIDTLPMMWRDLMSAPNVETPCCAVCGRSWPLNRHHMVPRSAGNMYDGDGRRLEKPTVVLCGSGNTGGCHGKAHSGRMHFRNTRGFLEVLELDEGCDRLTALEMEGWRRL